MRVEQVKKLLDIIEEIVDDVSMRWDEKMKMISDGVDEYDKYRTWDEFRSWFE